MCTPHATPDDSAKPMIRHARHVTAALLALLAPAALAGPATQVSTQLSGLHITHYKEDSPIRTVLHATNHEAYSVICDAEMRTNIEENKVKLNEIRIPPGKTAPFVFRYTRGVTKLNIYLICVPTEEKALVEQEGKVEGSDSEQATDRIVIKKLPKTEETTKTVPVEDLGKF